MGMGMTEKQGGSDVRANTHARRVRRPTTPGASAIASPATSGSCRRRCATPSWCWRRPAAGLSCFFLPRLLPDGSVNAIRIQRLKHKLGNQANASSEVEFDGATAWLVGDEGRGVPQILAMGTMTRLDCALGTAGLMRQALSHRAAPHGAAQGLRQAPDRAADDEERAGRSGAGKRGRHRAGDAPGARRRPHRARQRRARGRDAPPADADRQVLGLQARQPLRAGGDGMPGRQRLRRRATARA